jgi:heme-degrading monooxygenase HmoA
MFMRFIYLKIKPEFTDVLPSFYNKMILPELQKISGCLFGGLVKKSENPQDYVSVTIWDSLERAEVYEKSESYRKTRDRIRPYLAESSAWEIHLSDDLQLQYDSGVEDPVIREYRVTAQQQSDEEPQLADTPLYVRLVSLKIQKGKLDEFRQLFSKEIVPVLQRTGGCRYIYLTESLQDDDEIVSITVWDSKQEADAYEQSGQFEDLVQKVKHTFSQVYQWKMQLEKKSPGKIKTSEDMKIEYYGLVSGRRFE